MNIALIFAGGIGSRMNTKAMPKQFLEIHGKAIIIHTIEVFEKHPEINAICVVCLSEKLQYLKDIIANSNIMKIRWILAGGSTAIESQYKGIKTVADDVGDISNTVVLLHDGVRPLIDEDIISRCIESVKTHGSGITVAPATETIVTTDCNQIITSALKRSECCLARAPQCFMLQDLISIHERAIHENHHDFVDSATMMQHYGKILHAVEGPVENIKVTTPADYYICKALLDVKENRQLWGL